MVKRLADMRWSAHFDAVYVLREGFADIFNMHWILHQLTLTSDQEMNKRRETEGLRKRMESLETIFLTTLWKDILERANKTSKVLQSKDVDMLVAMYLLESLRGRLS